MRRWTRLGTLLATFGVLIGCFSMSEADRIPLGRYLFELETPAGPLPFVVELEPGTARIKNGSEWIEADLELRGHDLRIDFPHYASEIEARWHPGREELRGHWRKRRGGGREATVVLRARPGEHPRFERDEERSTAFDGRWAVHFDGDDDRAVAVFRSVDGELRGTFLTTTGDYRFLEGVSSEARLRLSCFDGAHAFLFDARPAADGALEGVFWSGNWWHTDWRATRSDTVELADAFAQTTWKDDVRLDQLEFRDLEGRSRNLADPEFAGRARVIQIFGSWCPNCHDASEYLRELHERYAGRGLAIVALAFELSGDFDVDRVQVERSIERHRTPYPVLLAGVADKSTATEQLGALDRVRSYPTTIFLRGDGTVRAVHTGFTGPATGGAYLELRERFEALVEELLEER